MMMWTAQDDENDTGVFKDVNPPHLMPSATMDSEADKWPVSQIMRLLRFYAAHRCLWDVECEDNHSRKMRSAALIDITAAMGGNLTKEELVQKISVIRATYRYEKRRIKQRMRWGLGARTKLKWFALADAFLRKVPKKGQRKEDPPNSDSDLEDAVIFTINPEGLGPLLPQNTLKELENCSENNDTLVAAKTETFVDDTPQFTSKGWEAEYCNDSFNSNNGLDFDNLREPKFEDIEDDLQEQLKMLNKAMQAIREDECKEIKEESHINQERNQNFNLSAKQVQFDTKGCITSQWTLDTSMQFIQQLKQYSELCVNSIECIGETEQQALQSLARAMNRPLKSIAKRWRVFRQTYEREKQMILENPLYKPPYKWWNEAEVLMEAQAELKTESIYLEEKESLPTSTDNDDEEEYENRFQNPIPSVAPMSNMNEAMASLFHEDFSLGSTTTSSLPVETALSNQAKIICKGLEDDLLEGKWSLKHSVKFLRLYGVHRCLWDLNDPNYRSRPLRNAAIEDIAASMAHGLTASYVAKKIKIFRITYMQQRKRILEATQRGETPEILLKWFPLADSFLRPHIGLRSIKSDAKEMPQFDFQYVYANLNLIDPALLNDFRGKGTQNAIDIGNDDDEASLNSDGDEC